MFCRSVGILQVEEFSTAISQTAIKIFMSDETAICVYPNPQARRQSPGQTAEGAFIIEDGNRAVAQMRSTAKLSLLP